MPHASGFGEPLRLDEWYLDPAEIAKTARSPNPYQARLGDVYMHVPSLYIHKRPLTVVRPWKQYLNPHPEFGEPTPKDGLKFTDSASGAGGEDVVVKAGQGLGVLLVRDCEIDKSRPRITFAAIRTFAEDMDPAPIRERRRYRFFYLRPDTNRGFPESYVDFARLTTIERDAIRKGDRLLSMSDQLRDAMREWFIYYMTIDEEEDEE